MSESILEVEDLKKHYQISSQKVVKALDGISFKIEAGKTLAIVGESGCGKSTLAKQLLGLETPTDGRVFLEGQDHSLMNWKERVHKVQMCFQDPYSSLNPRKPLWKIISEPLIIQNGLNSKEAFTKAVELMGLVGLPSALASRYPHMLSGGQRQRVGLARALGPRPKIIVLDEPVSALDVSVQAQVLNLLVELQKEFNLTYLFISHDLSVVKHFCDDILVMYLGKKVEYAPNLQLFDHPLHPYTQALLSSAVDLKDLHKDQDFILKGELPSPLNPPSGCSFHTRCPKAIESCHKETPELIEKNSRQWSCPVVNETP